MYTLLGICDADSRVQVSQRFAHCETLPCDFLACVRVLGDMHAGFGSDSSEISDMIGSTQTSAPLGVSLDLLACSQQQRQGLATSKQVPCFFFIFRLYVFFTDPRLLTPGSTSPLSCARLSLKKLVHILLWPVHTNDWMVCDTGA